MIVLWVSCFLLSASEVSLETSTVEVGEPTALVLEIEEPLRLSAADQASFGPESSWIVFDVEETFLRPTGPAKRVRIEFASTSPGEREVPLEWLLSTAGLAARDLPQSPVLTVVGLLEEGEDEARPLHGFPAGFSDAAGEETGAARWPWALAIVILLSAGFWWLWRRRARGVEETYKPAPRESLTRLQAQPVEDLEAERLRHFELSRLVREATDASLGTDRSGLTDEEWLSTLETGHQLGVNEHAELSRLLERCAAVKYAGKKPTAWATEEVFAQADKLLLRAEADGRSNP